MVFGACYYPEHWPEERWALDAKLMREAGLDTVRIGEFAWSRLERFPGVYTFDWLDRSIAILAAQGIRVIMGTPTAAPPKWLMDRHPDIYMRDRQGIARGFGNRRHYCYNNADYLAAAHTIVTQMAQRYGSNAIIMGWQTDNEFGCNDTARCYCDSCKQAFQKWLEQKYGDIDALNTSWGTVFWSQIYNSWEEIGLPAYTVFHLHNPGMELDYRQFASDSVIAFQKQQLDILRQWAPTQPVTHNMWGEMNEIDSYGLSRDLDFISWDLYPNLCFNDQPDPRESAIQLDMARGLKQRSFWVMEHQSGPPGGNILFATPKPGELRRWTYHSVAHGADAIVYFRWRTALFGAEQYWHGILPHDGVPGRRYKEVQQVGAELKRLLPLLEGSGSGAEVALIRSYDNEWSMEVQPQILGHTYMNHFKTYYQTFFNRHIPVDLVPEEVDFSLYRLIVLPHFMISRQDTAERLHEYVRQGGTVILDFRAGTRLPDNRMSADSLPGIYRELLGIRITDYGTLRDGMTVRVKLPNSEAVYHSQTWYDVIELETAEPAAIFEEDYFSGHPAVTVHSCGLGTAYYLGMEPQPNLMDALLERICSKALVSPIPGIRVPEGVELARRRNLDKEYWVVINHEHTECRTILLEQRFMDLNRQKVTGRGC